MRERGDILVGLLVAFLLLFPLGYFVHISPRFPGSPTGGMVGIAAAMMMILTLPYVIVKHVGWADRCAARHVSKPTLLAIHIYAGVLASILGLIHAAHTLESPLGVILTGAILLTVLTGYVGRYLLGQLAKAMRGRKSELASLQSAFLKIETPPSASTPEQLPSSWRRYFFVSGETPVEPIPHDAAALAAALADTEFTVRAEEATNALFGKWRWLHIFLGSLVYGLLLLHVWVAIYYGLRWL